MRTGRGGRREDSAPGSRGAIFDSDGDTWDNMLEAAGKWMSDSNSTVRDLRKIYRYRINGEPQQRR